MNLRHVDIQGAAAANGPWLRPHGPARRSVPPQGGRRLIMAVVLPAVCVAAGPALAQGAAALLAEYSAKAGRPASAEAGQKFFTTNFGRELGFSCSSCHTERPTRTGKDQVTEKSIAPLAPGANAKRFTDRSRVEFMFRMNCVDVVGRECTAAEKADVLSWLVSLKP